MNRKGILVVSFGTSYKETREKTIDKIEEKIQNTFKDYKIYRAFTSKIIIKKMLDESNIKINTVIEAIDLMIKDGIKDLIVQPTHIINGLENDEMINDIKKHIDDFDLVKLGSPLITYQSDYLEVIDILKKEYSFLEKNDHVILMGHGSSHFANATYPAFDYILKDLGINNMHIATVEGYPTLSSAIKILKKSNARNVYLVPLMIVAGDHALNDMSGSQGSSWKNILESKGFNVKCILKGLGEYPSIHNLFIEHINHAFILK